MTNPTRFLLLTVATTSLSIAACGGDEIIYENCPPFCLPCELDGGVCGTGGASSTSTSGSGGSGGEAADAGDGGPSCAGDCVPLKLPNPFNDVMIVWFGAPDSAPPCPEHAPALQYEGYANLVIPEATCAGCVCGPSAGSCSPPTSYTAHSEVCPGDGPGSIATSFDPPMSWDGSCSAANSIPAGLNCGGKSCVRSVSVGPLSILDESCVPEVVEAKPIPTPYWQESVKACYGMTNPPYWGCEDPGAMCMPKAIPAGFRHCVYATGEHVCPETGYSEKHLAYGGFTGERLCSECSCGAAMGGTCSAMSSIYEDGACTVPLLLFPVSSSDGPCVDLVGGGQAIGSKKISGMKYNPGVCQALGGELSSTVAPVDPTTFCCVPELPPPL